MATTILALALFTLAPAAALRWPLENAVGPPGPRTFNVVAYGAKVGCEPGLPSCRDNSAAFAAALAAIERAGGGTLLVPGTPSGVFLTLPLNLTTPRTRLRVERGATLKALCDNERWPRIPTLPSYSNCHGSKGSWFAAFIGASNVQDITLEGGGIIDASGECFWGPSHPADPAEPSHMEGSRGNLLLFERVQRAELTGLTFTNSPFWTLHLWDSEDLHVHGITVHNPASSDNDDLFFGPNTDGIVRHPAPSTAYPPASQVMLLSTRGGRRTSTAAGACCWRTRTSTPAMTALCSSPARTPRAAPLPHPQPTCSCET